MAECCDDGRFEEIEKLKKYFLENTNIYDSKEEMAVLDSMCFRMWQSGLTLTTREKARKYDDLNLELGCPVEVYIKLTSSKVVWWMNKDGSMRRNLDTDIDYIIINEGEKNIVVLDYEYDDIDGNSAYNIFYFKDYKKTWWLKEDKSE